MAEAGDQSVEQNKEDVQYRSPLGVTADEEGDSIVRVCVVIPGLKTKLMGSGFSNADVKVSSDGRSLLVIVVLQTKDKNGKKKQENYRYQVKQLPDDIEKLEEKDHKVDHEKGKVVIRLKKKVARSWRREMSRQCFRVVDNSSSEEDNSSTSNDS